LPLTVTILVQEERKSAHYNSYQPIKSKAPSFYKPSKSTSLTTGTNAKSKLLVHEHKRWHESLQNKITFNIFLSKIKTT
jgi:hypothetical protein